MLQSKDLYGRERDCRKLEEQWNGTQVDSKITGQIQLLVKLSEISHRINKIYSDTGQIFQ